MTIIRHINNKKNADLDVVVHARSYRFLTQAEAKGSRVLGQIGLYSKILSKNLKIGSESQCIIQW